MHLSSWQQIEQKYAELEKREKVMLMATLLVTMLVGVQGLFVDPLEKKMKDLRDVEGQVIEEMSTLNITLVEKQLQVEVDIDEPTRIEIAELEARLQQLQGRLNDKIADLIAPSEMKTVLSGILKTETKLKLTELKNVPVKSIQSILQEQEQEELLEEVVESSNGRELYRHGLEFSFKGSFSALTALLEKIESLSWKFYWSDLHFRTISYPLAEVKLTIYTLSNDEEVIAI